MCLRKTVHLIQEVSFCNFGYSSGGLLRWVPALWVWFLLVSPIENNERSCPIGMLLLNIVGVVSPTVVFLAVVTDEP